MSEFDSPWKEALDRFLRLFLEFFFADIAADIDWSRGYEILDKELEQIVREGEAGKRLADKLFKVWRTDGEETWVLIHIEVQAQVDAEFSERMFVYHYRIFDRFRRPVVSLALLGDERAGWRPDQFGYNVWGCRLLLQFRVAKLLDYANDLPGLEANPNPFGLIVLAHLQSQATRDNAEGRYGWKVRLVKRLLDRGIEAEDIRQLFKVIDWLLDLPQELTQLFNHEIHEYEKEKKMPFVTSLERLGIQQGIIETLALGLEKKYGAAGLELVPALRSITDLERLRDFQRAFWATDSLESLRNLLPQTPTSS